MTATDPCLFIRHGDRFDPTRLTMGPWRPDAQHGGPPSALLTFLAEELVEDDETVARVKVELRASVPLTPLIAAATRSTISRRVAHITTTLSTPSKSGPDKIVASAETTVLRQGEHPAPSVDPAVTPPPLLGPEHTQKAPGWASGDAGTPYHRHALEHRPVIGGFGIAGPSQQWIKLLVPVVAGTEPTGPQRVMASADVGSGISAIFGPETGYGLINADLDVMFVGDVTGPWLLLDSRTHLAPAGTGGALTTLSDEQGVVAIGTQALLGTRFST